MARGTHHLGRKRSEGFKRRVREGIARRQAEGLHFGRKRERLIEGSICETCREPFLFTHGGKTDRVERKTSGRFCSKPCLVKWLHKHRKKLPDAKTLERLYKDYGLTTPEIARLFGLKQPRSVGQAMQKAGIKRRRSGPRNAGVCIEEGCAEPVHKIQHKTNGSWYGRRCYEHWCKHRNRLQKVYIESNPAQRERRDEYMKRYHRKNRNERMAAGRVAL